MGGIEALHIPLTSITAASSTFHGSRRCSKHLRIRQHQTYEWAAFSKRQKSKLQQSLVRNIVQLPYWVNLNARYLHPFLVSS